MSRGERGREEERAGEDAIERGRSVDRRPKRRCVSAGCIRRALRAPVRPLRVSCQEGVTHAVRVRGLGGAFSERRWGGGRPAAGSRGREGMLGPKRANSRLGARLGSNDRGRRLGEVRSSNRPQRASFGVVALGSERSGGEESRRTADRRRRTRGRGAAGRTEPPRSETAHEAGSGGAKAMRRSWTRGRPAFRSGFDATDARSGSQARAEVAFR